MSSRLDVKGRERAAPDNSIRFNRLQSVHALSRLHGHFQKTLIEKNQFQSLSGPNTSRA